MIENRNLSVGENTKPVHLGLTCKADALPISTTCFWFMSRQARSIQYENTCCAQTEGDDLNRTKAYSSDNRLRFLAATP